VAVVAPADPSAPAMLVRPDAYIAWAGDRPDPAQLAAALTASCGPADPARSDLPAKPRR
jgi:hypothetical protein